ncbi:cyclin-dependent kinase 15 isoform X2 [Oryzias latipes]
MRPCLLLLNHVSHMNRRRRAGITEENNMEELSRSVREAGCWVRRCFCGEEEEHGEEKDSRKEEEEEEEEACSGKNRSWTSLAAAEVSLQESGETPDRCSASLKGGPLYVPLVEVDSETGSSSVSRSHWFHTLQTRRLKVHRGRSNSDPLRGAPGPNPFTWKPGLEFGAVQSYLSLEKLGEGAFASVYKGISRINGQLVALKEIRMNTEEVVPFTAIREASLLKRLKHANIVLLHDIVHTRETLTFVFEYVQTDLAQYMTQHPGGLHSHNVRAPPLSSGPSPAAGSSRALCLFQIFMFQLLRGLCYIHSRRILHRDLKPQNLLISYLGELKLADFGLARSKSIPSHSFSSEVVTLWYRPPDVLLGSTDYSVALDMWGAGCILIEMLQGAPAFPGGPDELEQLKKIFSVLGVPSQISWPELRLLSSDSPDHFVPCEPKHFRTIWTRLEQLPPKTEDLAQEILKVVPAERICAQEALHHPYFSTLPPAVMHLRDTVSIFRVPGVYLETEFSDIFHPRRKANSSMLTANKY